MRSNYKVTGALALIVILMSSCAPERGFVLSVKNSSGELLRDLTVKWEAGSVELGWLPSGSEKIQYDNPLPVPSLVTLEWKDELAVAHHVVSEMALPRGDKRRVFLTLTLMPDDKVQVSSSHELSADDSHRP
jgi:hypothetical protein